MGSRSPARLLRPLRSRVRQGSAVLVAAALLLAGAACEDEADDGPATTSPEAAVAAGLSIRPVLAVVDEGATTSRPNGVVLHDAAADQWLDLGAEQLTSDDVAEAEASQGQTGWQVNIDFTDEGNAEFGDLTERAACEPDPRNRIAVVVDEVIVSAPVINVSCGGRIDNGTQINGNFTQADAEQLAARIDTGR